MNARCRRKCIVPLTYTFALAISQFVTALAAKQSDTLCIIHHII